jgi:hypothetical protein
MLDKRIAELKEKVEEHEKRISELEELIISKPEDIKKGISIREFILDKRPRNDVQKTLSIGYYLEKYENMPFFNVKDLEKGFREAKEMVPSNINDKVNLNIKKMHMMESKEKKEGLKCWNLTNIGERFVKNDFMDIPKS